MNEGKSQSDRSTWQRFSTLFRRYLTLSPLLSRIEHEPFQLECEELALLDDEGFEGTKAKHLARRTPPASNDNLGVTFVLALVAAPTCLVAGVFTGDIRYLWSTALWIVIGVPIYIYLACVAKYWRWHTAIRREEKRRFGRTSFG